MKAESLDRACTGRGAAKKRSLATIAWVCLIPLLVQAILLTLPEVAAARGSGPEDSQAEPERVPGDVIVGFEEGVSESERNEVLAKIGAIEEDEFEEIDAELVEVEPGEVDEAIKKLEDDPRVSYAEPNFIVTADTHPTNPVNSPNDTSFHELWGLHNTGQVVNGVTGVADADIDAPEAWGVTKGSSSVTVGVIDSGVDFTHPDLAGAQWINPGEDCLSCRTDGVDNDLNGLVDDWRGWDFVNNDNNPFDDNGHGTHVAGTIGGVGDNATGVVGVNWTTRIMALKFLSAAGSGTTANAIKAVDYASTKGAGVTNNSWGGGGFSQALLDAIRNADVKDSLFVAAAGNDGVNADTSPHYPSSYDAPNVVSVAATTSSDLRASFSNYGKKTVDLGAPGANIFSTYPGNTYRYLSGTSMATPHVAGAAALIKAAFPSASDLGIKTLLLRSVDPNTALSTTGFTPVATGGRLNVNTAVSCSNTPRIWIDAPLSGFAASVGDQIPVKVFAANCANTTPSELDVTATGSVSGSTTVITLVARGDGLYTGTYSPPTSGPVTITATASGTATGSGPPDSQSVTGSASANYRFEDAPFSWVDATAGGTQLPVTGDDVSATVSLPFSFTFHGESFTSLNVSSNGYVVFGGSAATAFSNQAIPNSGVPNGFAAPFWDDLDPSKGGAVWTKTIGAAGDQRFAVEWAAVRHFSAPGAATFEIVLEQKTNDIYFQYQNTNVGDAAYNHGASATVGVENLDGTKGRQFSHNLASLQPYDNTKAIRFTESTPGVTITTASLADATVAQAYSQTLQASGGTLPYTWSIVEGTLPAGLTLDPATGAISGTPTAAGTSTFTAKATDASLPTALSATKSLSITVGTPVSITTTSLPAGATGQPYSATLAASGGKPPYTWAIEAGTLPPGLSLNASTGTISGTPSSAGTHNFTVRVGDSAGPTRTASRALAITVAPGPVAITTTSLANGALNVAYSQTLQAVGGTTPYTWSIFSGPLPPGLALDASTGTVSGTPSKGGVFNFTVQVTDSSAPAQTDTKALSITVTTDPLTITTTALNNGKRNRAYSQTLQATGGTKPYSWSIVGALPPGLALNASTGTISGTPTRAGTFTFTVQVADDSSPTKTATKVLSIKIRN